MRFEQKCEFGVLGEHLVLDILRFQDSIKAKLNTGPGFQQGYGIRFHDGDSSEIVPDIEGIRYAEWPRRTFYVEVKTKSTFACLEMAENQLRTGLDKKAWEHYKWFLFTQGPVEFYVVFVQVLPLAQKANNVLVLIDNRFCGLYRGTLEFLDDHKISGSDGKWYWDIEDLEMFRGIKALITEHSTRTLWEKLETRAKRYRKVT